MSNASACQLAAAWLLAEQLGLSSRAWADPQMRAADVAAANALGFEALEPEVALQALTAAAAAEAATSPVLLFMPHCDRALYERVLLEATGGRVAEHAREAALQLFANVVLIGNSFSLYADRDELRVVPEGSPGAPGATNLICEMRPFIQEELLPEYAPCSEAFNDLAVLSFSSDKTR